MPVAASSQHEPLINKFPLANLIVTPAHVKRAFQLKFEQKEKFI